ncbi:FAD-dependent oxidoreductase [Kangiella sp. HD9-110m-PIT-SAG07]|nr:FAD-dependent oxidoreductase [Kangiella sp. HD9-110m-PIT-SAG07]
MHNAFLGVKPAVIEWRQYDSEKRLWLTADADDLSPNAEFAPSQFAPYSPAFDDIYYNPQDGVAESTHVFLEGNNLAQRFSSIANSSDSRTFNIFETGFGTGLNFLLTARLWHQEITKDSKCELHYWSVEQFPINPKDLRQIYTLLGIESDFSNAVIDNYPDALPGIHKIQVAKNITLHLVFFPIKKALKELALPQTFAFDAWFLDGFAPSKNPDMWAKGLLHFMALHSHSSTTLSTFTVASVLKKPLPHYGFAIEKRPGFGRKREMLTAQFSEKELSPPKPTLATNYISPRKPPNKVAIIGAGLAGCSLAHTLHQQDVEVHLFDRKGICGGASNMPSLVALPVMSIDHNAYSQLTFHGFQHLKDYINQHPKLAHSNLVHQLHNRKYPQHHIDQYQDIYSAQTWEQHREWFQFQSLKLGTSDLKSLKIPAVQVNGREFCQHLIQDLPKAQLHLKATINSLTQLSDFDHIIIASGYLGASLSGDKPLPQVAPMRGQLTTLKAKLQHRTPVNHDGHIAHYKDQLVIGATFENSSDDSIQRKNSLHNIERVNQRFGFDFKEKDIADEHPGVRATSYDRFPFCGYFNQMSHNGSEQSVWLNYGFGARGLCFSMLCADVISCSMLGKPSPLPKTLLSRLSPLRV